MSSPRYLAVLGLVLASGLGSCDRKEAPSTPARSAAPPEVRALPPPAPAPAGVRSADVRSLIDAWQAAQNRGDFAAYAALYDDTFKGLKRVGPKAFRFDRQGWLEDRRGMFQHDMSVVARDVRIFTGQRSALAVFAQDFRTARYADVGQKRLELTLRGGKLLISHEEMLESRANGPGSVAAPPPEELALVVRLPEGLGVVLRSGGVEGTGKVRPIASPSELQHRVERDASPADIRPYLQLLGRRFDFYDAATQACTGRVKAFVGVTGVFGSDELGPEVSPQGKADAVWEWAESARYLAAVVEPDRANCKAQWARASDLPAPAVFEARPLSAPELEKAMLSLGKTRVAREVQAGYEQYQKDVGAAGHSASWLAWSSPERSATLFVDPATQRSYAAIELAVGEGCGDFAGYALGFFKLTPQGWLDVTGDGDPRHALPARPLFGVAPSAAVSLRAGAAPFFIGGAGDVLYAQGPPGFVPVSTVGEIRTVCGC